MLKSSYWQGFTPSEESIFFFFTFLASRGYLCSLAHGHFHLHTQQTTYTQVLLMLLSL